MFCGNCGQQIPDDAAFCPSCGQSVQRTNGVNDAANEAFNNAGSDNYSGGAAHSSAYYEGYASAGRGPKWDDTRRTGSTGIMNFIGFYGLMWKNYINSKGRATRTEFWSIVIINWIITLICSRIWTPLASIYSLAVLVPTICVYIRRAHDFGKSGSFVVLIYVFEFIGTLLASVGAMAAVYYFYWMPAWVVAMMIIGVILMIISIVMMFYIGLKGSVPMDNEYGPYPFR